jgi:hypothetical protein
MLVSVHGAIVNLTNSIDAGAIDSRVPQPDLKD